MEAKITNSFYWCLIFYWFFCNSGKSETQAQEKINRNANQSSAHHVSCENTLENVLENSPAYTFCCLSSLILHMPKMQKLNCFSKFKNELTEPENM